MVERKITESFADARILNWKINLISGFFRYSIFLNNEKTVRMQPKSTSMCFIMTLIISMQNFIVTRRAHEHMFAYL